MEVFMFYLFSALIIIVNIFFSLHPLFFKGANKEKAAKTVKIVILVFSLLGILLSSAVSLMLRLRLNAAELEAEYVSWAKDMYFGFVRFAAIFFLLVTVLSVLSYLFSKKNKIIRGLLVILSSVIFIISGFLYSYIASNDTVALTPYILLFSLGLSLAVSFPLSLDTSNVKK